MRGRPWPVRTSHRKTTQRRGELREELAVQDLCELLPGLGVAGHVPPIDEAGGRLHFRKASGDRRLRKAEAMPRPPCVVPTHDSARQFG